MRAPGFGGARGFSLLEVMFAMVILAVGLISVLALFASSMATMALAQKDLIAKQKAEDALESIYSARNTGQTTFDSVQNVSSAPGLFLDGPQPLLDRGPDGLPGTADDDATKPDELVLPGPDGLLGTADDIHLPLLEFKRQIAIVPVLRSGGGINPDLRQITVTLTYPALNGTRTYRVAGYISRYR